MDPGASTKFSYSTPYTAVGCAVSTTCERDATGQFMRAKIQLNSAQCTDIWQYTIWSGSAPVYSNWEPVDRCATAEFGSTLFGRVSTATNPYPTIPPWISASFTCCGCQPKTNGNSVTCACKNA